MEIIFVCKVVILPEMRGENKKNEQIVKIVAL